MSYLSIIKIFRELLEILVKASLPQPNGMVGERTS